ncbi:GDSL-like Lipase/Acylhydrolase [Caballeronia peredens]|nr:GDSL-like Lipase/Acylhydrolase [Caballeronia peredens]
MNARAEAPPPLHRQLMQYDELLGYRFVPGLKVRIPHEGGGYLVKTNGAGFRCNHEATPQKNRAHRVLVFGDSYTAGDGVSNGKRYSDVLEENLPDTEVLNFGLSGSGTDQQYLIYREFAQKIDFDAVVISVLVENIQRNVVKHREWADREGAALHVPKPWFELSDCGAIALQGVPVPQPFHRDADQPEPDAGGLLSRARKMVNGMGPEFKDKVQKLTRFQPLPEYDSRDSHAWRLLRAILLHWISEVKVPVMIAVLPVYQYVEKTASYTNVRKRFDELAADCGAPVHHIVDDLWKFGDEERRGFRFRGDVHMTPPAHRAVGVAMADYLRPLIG